MEQLRFDLEDERSPFAAIAALGGRVEAEACIPWLRRHDLMEEGEGQRAEEGRGSVLTVRAQKRSADELRRIKQQRTQRGVYDPYREQVWSEYQDPSGALAALDLNRPPVDAIAFYHPFHLEPAEEWGIYIRVDGLLGYVRDLAGLLKGRVFAFSPDSLLAFALSEVFHHEFFHHLEECAATTIEMLSSAQGEVRRVYWDYRNHHYERELGPHPHKPLAEALANAYAYNSFSFYQRARLSFRVVQVRMYQAIMRQCWRSEPPGYCHANHYTGAKYVSGAAQLLAMMLRRRTMAPEALSLLAKCVFLHGHSAFAHKARVPTYFVGSRAALETFAELVPAPVETCTNLFALQLEETAALDLYLAQRRVQEGQAANP